MFDEIISYIKELQAAEEGVVPLHTPFFGGNEKKYLLDCIDSTYVSSVGKGRMCGYLFPITSSKPRRRSSVSRDCRLSAIGRTAPF